MAWTTVDGVRLWLDDASGLAQLRDRSGTIRQVNPSEAVRQMVAFDFAPATPDDVHAYDQAKRAGGAGRAAATGAVAGALDVAAGAASLYPAMLTAAGKPALRAYLRSQGKSEAEIEAALASAAPYEPLRIVREALGGREVMENVAAVGAEALGGEGEAAALQWRKTEQATAAEHPLASGAGYAGGQIAATLALPGVGGAIRGAGLGGRVLLGAAEGTALGAATAGEDAYIKDHELTAEHLLAGAGVSGVLGFGLVLGLHGAGRIWQRIGTRGATGIDAAMPEALHATGNAGLTEMAENVLGQAPAKGTVGLWRSILDKGTELYEKGAGIITGKGPEAVRRVGLRDVMARGEESAIAKWENRAATREAVSRELHDELGNLHSALDRVTSENVLESQKAVNIAPLVRTTATEADRVALEAAQKERAALEADLNKNLGMGPDGTFWRVNQADDPLATKWRSEWQSGDLEGKVVREEGTSATASREELFEWATGEGKYAKEGGVPPTGPVDIIKFRGRRIGVGADGEPIVVPVKELARYRANVPHINEAGNHIPAYRAWAELPESSWSMIPAKAVEGAEEFLPKLQRLQELRAIKGTPFDVQKTAALADLARIRSAAEDMINNTAEFGATKQTRGFLQALDRVGTQINSATDGASVYTALDLLKRRVQRFSLSARRASVGNVQGWLAGPQAEAVANRLDQIQEPTRQLLMDAGVWGERAATAQREINAAWENLLGDKAKGIPGTHETFSRNFFDVTPGVDYATGRPAFIPSAQKVAGFVGRMGRFEAEAVEENLNRQIAAADRMADTITREYGLKGAAAADANTVRSAAGKIRELLAKHKDDLRTFAEIDDLLAAEGGGLGGVGTGALGGGMLGGPGFAAAGALLGGMAKPISTARTVRAAMALAGNVKSQLRGDVASVVTSRTPRRLLPATGTVLAPAAATVGARYSLEERQDRWRKQAEIVQASQNPAELQERITQALGTLPRDMPATAGMVAAKSSSIAAYLQERLGPMIPPQSPLQPNLPVRPIGRSDMAKWEGIWQAATNPRSVLVAWKAGRVTKDQVDTLRACWPRLFADLQQDAAERIGQLKEPLTYAQRRSIDQLLGLGGLAEPTLSPGFLARTEERNQARLQVQQNRPAPKAAPSLENLYSMTKEIT